MTFLTFLMMCGPSCKLVMHFMSALLATLASIWSIRNGVWNRSHTYVYGCFDEATSLIIDRVARLEKVYFDLMSA